MTLCEAIKIVDSKGITPWMAWGVLKWNGDYVICDTSYMKRFPDLPYVYVRKGEAFPNPPLFPFYKIF